MRRTVLLLLSLMLGGTLGGCDDLVTAVDRNAGVTPRFALANGPVIPIDGGLVTSPVVTIDDRAGNQFGPQLSGDLVCYTAFNVVRYYRFSTGVSTTVPDSSGVSTAGFCGMFGNNIGYRRVGALVGFPPTVLGAIRVFDVGTAAFTTVPNDYQTHTGLTMGGSTLAFDRLLATGTSEVHALDLTAIGQSVLLSSSSLIDRFPRVAPAGNLVVWEQCDAAFNCDIVKAVQTGGVWGAPQYVANSLNPERYPDTDGSYIVYAVQDLSSQTLSDIYIQDVATGVVANLAIGNEENQPVIHSGVIAFRHHDPGTIGGDIWVYVIGTNTMYRVTNTPTVNETTYDVELLANGDVRVAWNTGNGIPADVFATTFTPTAPPPPPPPPLNFGGFLAPIGSGLNTVNAGRVVAVRFSLGGNKGLNIFMSGSPSSAPVATCGTATPAGPETPVVKPGNSPLSYDPVTDTYTFLWQTSGTWVNTCRTLKLHLTDNTVHIAHFHFI